MKNLKKLTLTLVALFAMTTGAWAAGTVYNTTVELKDLKVGDVLTEGFKLTTDKGQYIYVKGYKKDGGTAETGDYTQLNAYNSTFPGGVTISESGSTYTPYADSKDANAWIVSDFKDYGSATMLYLDGYNYTAAPAGTALTPDATRKVWTLDAMPAGNVELQVAYFPGMLTLPAKTAEGSIEVVGLGGETLPAGFDTDGTNIYVEPKTQFQVKAVPAEGYHLVSLSDGTNTYEVDADGIATITMPADGSDFTVTATFSDEFELTFDDVNFKTNKNITVKVGDADKTLGQDGKLSVKAGQTVTLTAKQGYKFRSVEAKKGAGEPVLLTTITAADNSSFKSGSQTFGDVATVTLTGDYLRNDGSHGGWYCQGSNKTATISVAAANGANITSVKFYTAGGGSAEDKDAPFEVTTTSVTSSNITTYLNGNSIGSYGVSKIEVYGTK